MARYIASISNITPTGGLDILTLRPSSSGRLRVLEVSCAGQGSASASQKVEVCRSSSGSTPGAQVSPANFGSNDQSTMQGIAYSSWSGQPVVDTNPEPLAFNAMGGANRWQPLGGAFESRSTASMISFRASTASTWQAMSICVVVEEDF